MMMMSSLEKEKLLLLINLYNAFSIHKMIIQKPKKRDVFFKLSTKFANGLLGK